MNNSTLNDRIIFGLRIKQQRRSLKMSFAELSKVSGLSVSYLNEIEKGKKYPKPEKLKALFNALNLEVEGLEASEFNQSLSAVDELLRSNFLNELPLDFFGIEVAKIAEIITNAPTKVSAFIATLLEISKNNALNKENFYFSALRSYLQLNYNYFPELEKTVEAFAETHHIPRGQLIQAETLEQILINKYDYVIDNQELDSHEELVNLKSLYLPASKYLLMSSQLTPIQTSFQFGKELAFNVLKLKERANTSSIMAGNSFTQVHNHSQAIYFSVVLHIPLKGFINKVRSFFQSPRWDEAAFEQIRTAYSATPEMFYHRLTNVLPAFFGIKKMFFLRFRHQKDTEGFWIDRELHLDVRHHPHGNAFNEHYCRRWVAISVLKELDLKANSGKPLVRIQKSKYWNTKDEYLSLTLAWPHPRGTHDVSVTLGLLITEQLHKQIHFLNDPTIPQVIVNKTCERCAIQGCLERAAPATILEAKSKSQRLQDLMNHLDNKFSQ